MTSCDNCARPSNCHQVTAVFVVLDNHPAHKTWKVVRLMEELQLVPLFMPEYSPELNSIERLWATVKERLKQGLAARMLDVRLGAAMERERFNSILTDALRFTRVAAVAAASYNRDALLKELSAIWD